MSFIAWHYVLSTRDVRAAHAEGREFYTQTGEPLHEVDAIRSAFRRDAVVVSVSR